jgi:HlyD family secretion protein
VLVVPNAALRFRPAEATDAAARGKSQPRAETRTGSIYTLEAGGLRAVPVRVGITDGRVTEIASGDLKPGDLVIVGAQVSAVETTQSTLRLRSF